MFFSCVDVKFINLLKCLAENGKNNKRPSLNKYPPQICAHHESPKVKQAPIRINMVINITIIDCMPSSPVTVGLFWTAPELLLTEDCTGTQAGDVYSFGIIMYELLTRDEPYSNIDPAMDPEGAYDCFSFALRYNKSVYLKCY